MSFKTKLSIQPEYHHKLHSVMPWQVPAALSIHIYTLMAIIFKTLISQFKNLNEIIW